jgi:tetratricopeptide (TPR) repeat protein
VHVEAARVLLDRFYRELVRGATIGHAVAQGRSALLSSNSRWIESGPQGRTITLEDWFLPHLYQRGLDETLFPSDAAVEHPVRQYDLFLSHNHNVSDRVESLARLLADKLGLRVWLDKWECRPGKLEPQCETGIRDSRFTVVVGSQAALDSKWVAWEIAKHNEFNPEGDRLIPIKFEPLQLPAELDGVLWVDFNDPARDAVSAENLARLIQSTDAEDARRRRGFRPPPEHGQPGCFPRLPQFGFQGRARELYELERRFRRQRFIVLHAMGGMGKTTLATEAALWWTRSGLFRDGACFLSFEQFVSADRVVQVLGNYCEGPKFDQRPAVEQRRRAIEFFLQRDLLMVWDNYESVLPQFNDGAAAHGSPYTDEERRCLADLARDLTNGPGRGCLLVTCRPDETGLPGVRRLELHGLARPDSLWLLHRILERDGLTLNDPRLAKDKLDLLLRDLADHPLSLELVGPHLQTLTPETIRADFGKLLKAFENKGADQHRNSSLVASLEFSRRHLSPAARAALPWLGLFSGGVFEDNLLRMSQIEPATWEPIRAELQGTALLRAENDNEIAGRPFLRFHPTLAIASADIRLAEAPETRQRFIHIYLTLMHSMNNALKGSQARAGLEILNREESNYRTAVQWAVADQQLNDAAALGDVFGLYLERSGRLRERDALVMCLREVLTQEGFTEWAAVYEREYARALFTSGDRQEAVNKLQTLLERLRQTTEFDPAFQLALATSALADMWADWGASTESIPTHRVAIGQWEVLVERIGGLPWEKLLDTPDYAKALDALGNLATTFGNLANSLGSAGKHSEALAEAKKALKISTKLGNHHSVAAAHGQCASILKDMGSYDEADVHYDQASAAAHVAGDKLLEGQLFHHHGSLAADRGQLVSATRLYKQALQLYHQAGATDCEIMIYNCLGAAERMASRIAEARAWYEKSLELAVRLQDDVGLATAAHNLSNVYQEEGETARKRSDEPAAEKHFETARRSVDKALQIWQARQIKPDEAKSLSQLARIDFLLGDFPAAERHAHAAREIHESLGLKEAVLDYDVLSNIAQARGDARAAAEWAQKRDQLAAEIERRASGDGLPAQMLKVLQQLAIACAQAGFDGADRNPSAEEALATLDGSPAPLPDFARHLRQIAAGQLPPISASLPAELRHILEQLTQAIREAQGGHG